MLSSPIMIKLRWTDENPTFKIKFNDSAISGSSFESFPFWFKLLKPCNGNIRDKIDSSIFKTERNIVGAYKFL